MSSKQQTVETYLNTEVQVQKKDLIYNIIEVYESSPDKDRLFTQSTPDM